MRLRMPARDAVLIIQLGTGSGPGQLLLADLGRLPPAGQDQGTAVIMAAARNRNAATGDTAVHRIPAMALAARLAPAWTVASSPNAEPHRCAGAKVATAAD